MYLSCKLQIWIRSHLFLATFALRWWRRAWCWRNGWYAHYAHYASFTVARLAQSTIHNALCTVSYCNLLSTILQVGLSHLADCTLSWHRSTEGVFEKISKGFSRQSVQHDFEQARKPQSYASSKLCRASDVIVLSEDCRPTNTAQTHTPTTQLEIFFICTVKCTIDCAPEHMGQFPRTDWNSNKYWPNFRPL